MARRKAGAAVAHEVPVGQAVTRPPGSRADYVHTVLHREILDGTLEPGAPILQDEIAARLGVSITPVREALRRLESVGLVSYQTHYGATVTELSTEALAELYLLRAAVEGLAARLAATRITPAQLDVLREIHGDMQTAQAAQDVGALASGSRRFHATIAEIGGPALLARHLGWIWDNYPVPQAASVWQFDDVASHGMAQHSALLDALGQHDAATAQRLMEEHIVGVPADRAAHEREDRSC